MEDTVERNSAEKSTQPTNGVGDTHRAISNTEKNGEINPNKAETAQPIGEGDTHQAREYANSSNQALHLMKPPSGENRSSLVSCEKCDQSKRTNAKQSNNSA